MKFKTWNDNDNLQSRTEIKIKSTNKRISVRFLKVKTFNY